MKAKVIKLLLTLCIVQISTQLNANDVNVSLIYFTAENRCFKSNGLPNHKVGIFPNRGNPNQIEEQNINVCVPLNPVKLLTYTKIRGIIGIAVNGVFFRPSTAGFWDPRAKRGHSRWGNKNWNVDIFGLKGRLGLDSNNAHVGKGGMYHYHGSPTGLIENLKGSLVGYAGDGFEIHYLPKYKLSGWVLKKGLRKSGPPGEYSGTYNEDYHFIGGDNRLDECNGGFHEGRYVYFITKTYPFIPRCLYGKVSTHFNKSRH
ncbi:MAG: YHYH protein [Rhodospirillaceae bacterium]|nr:YHYH protein [Rhodospirillaceae bacterium]